jgi:hypothetical protein
MVVVPPDTPLTMPLDAPTVATAVALLVQVPPPVASLRAVVDPGQTVVVPVMEGTEAFTVTAFIAIQPVGSV